MKSRHLWQTSNSQSFYKKPLICLVAFCLLAVPVLQVYANEITLVTEPTNSNDNSLLITPDQSLTPDPVVTSLIDNKPPIDDKLLDPINDNILDNNGPTQIPTDLPNADDVNPVNPVDPNETTDNENPTLSNSEMSSSGSGDLTQNPTGKVDGLYGSRPKNNLLTGAMTYSYPISVPSGRMGMTPNIDLAYNSQENDNGSVLGYGWGINIPYIERVNKNGTEKLYNQKYFTSSIDGELVEVSPNTYRPRVDNGSFNTYIYVNNNWEIIDKTGKKYFFGLNANSRQDDPTNNSKIYKWMLEKQLDTNSNYITYEYYKDSGQIYPYKINYTGFGGVNGIFDVEFLRENRPDPYTTYKTAFEVTTKYRINEVQVKINGVLNRKHVFEYTSGDNGYRSLISSVSSSSRSTNGSFITLPKTKFTYQKTNPGWKEDSASWTSPDFLGNGHEIAIDVKGDSWVDILKSVDKYGQNSSTGAFAYEKILYNHNTNKEWSVDNNFSIPTMFLKFEVRGGAYGNVWDQGVRLSDVNGDQLNDIVQSLKGGTYNGDARNDIYDTYLYNKTTGFVKDSNWTASIPFIGRYDINDYGTHMVDLNADGLPDIIRKQGDSAVEQINNGNGFDSITNNWLTSITDLTYPTNRIIDINADGLADVMQSNWYNTVTTANAFLNNGNKGLSINKSNWLSPMLFANAYYSQGVSFIDVNSDNLIDMVIDPKNQTGGNRGTYLNTGNGWTYRPAWDLPLPDNSLMSLPVVIADLDSDGFVDFMKTQNSSPMVTITYINKGKNIPDLLSKIEYGSGGYSEIKYKKSSQYKDVNGNLLNPDLPINLNTVESITNYDGIGNNAKTSYEYAGGSYYYNGPFDRKLAGFDKVTQINADNSKEVFYYHNANSNDAVNGEYDDVYSKIGKVYRNELFDPNGNLIKQTTNKWSTSAIGGSSSNFVYNTQTISRLFNGSNSYDIAVRYTYDPLNGNLLSQNNYGVVNSSGYQSFNDTGNDSKITEYEYTNCSIPCNNINLPVRVTVKDSLLNKVSESRIYYDNLPFGSVSIGNQTKVENWVSGGSYVSTQKSYNSLGLPTSITDARNNTTTINYDIYNLYPSSIANALSQTTNYTYDYNTGKIVHTVDINGAISETDYDGFGRPVSERSSTDNSATILNTTANYIYNDQLIGSVLPYVQKTTNYTSTLSGNSYSLYDGLGRVVRNLNQSGSGYIATDNVYDNMGRVYQTSLPYVLTGLPTSYLGPTNDQNIITTTTYDGLGRAIYITNTLGTTTNIYNLNTTTIVDTENHIKDIVYDAYGLITKVIEHNGSNNYVTNYEWDPNNNLIKITDSLGNIRTYTYNAIGNRLTATDLHDPLDTVYGSYSYSYDSNGNMVQKNTPNGDVVTYTYDMLNRIIRESNNGVAQINYTYDTCNNGVGKLCSISRTGSSTQNYVYTARGLISSQSMVLGVKNWSHEYLYDNLAKITQIKYPDNSSVRYSYNNLGQIISVERQDTPTGVWQNVVSNITYNPLGQKQSIQYANGRTQSYTYNLNKQYQLSRIVVDAPVTYIYPNFIDTNFVFSSTGNLLQKDENFNPLNSQKFNYSYDDLNRLTSVIKTVNAPLVGYTENYTYNALGNIVNKTGAGNYAYNGTSSGNYANPHAATTVGSVNYSYDKNGNLISWGTAPNNTDLTYNYRNELVNYKRITPPNPQNITYTYDDTGARIRTVNSAGTTYTPSKYFEENGTISKRYIYLGDQLIATVEDSGAPSLDVYYIHPDYLGGTQLVTDSSGAVKNQDLEYYPFGQVLSNTKIGSFDEKHKYTGHLYDAETGLNYMQARYQNGTEGRFWQQDPITRELDNSKLESLLINPQMWNTYAYASNNPLKYIDPDGNEPVKVYTGTISDFKNVLNNSGRQVGFFKGDNAKNYMENLGNLEINTKKYFKIEPAEASYFNNKPGRYIYTENGGWIDMAHFMFYAGKAYHYDNFSSDPSNPMGMAIQDGYFQEFTDRKLASYSAYSYEDLPSDKFGADFSLNYFNPKSELNLGEQIEQYMNNVLKATSPFKASNYENLPLNDSKNKPTMTNHTTNPILFNKDKK